MRMRRSLHSQGYASAVEVLVDGRHKAGLTQRALAEKLGKPRSFVSKIETGERRIDIVELVAIARALGVPELDIIRAIIARLPRRIEI